MISQTVKNQVIDQTNIVEVVGEVVSLTKKGSSYFGLCPFHNDNHPSMSVNNEKKMFNCFSCNTKGNVIYFVSRYHNITMDQATITLAKRLGIEISEAQSKEALREERLLKVMKEASNFYQFYLHNSEEGRLALEYLHNRGIDDEIINKLKIGLSSSEPNYLNLALNQKNCSELDQIELGLVKLNDRDKAYDVFRTRIMFPVENNSGQTVGFSGRIYQESNQAKYINSSDNAIFHKGQILYNFHNAISSIRESDKIILLEGFMDVIACMKADINNTVATMGTALTTDHVKSILQITKNITLCFDGDAAGIKAMKRSAELLAGFNILPKAVVLPNNFDPDEFFKAYGADALKKYLSENERSVYEWLYTLSKKSLNINDIESVESFKQDVFGFLKVSKSQSVVNYYLKKLGEDLNISLDMLILDYSKNTRIYNVEEINLPIEKKEPQQEVVKTKKVVIKPKVYMAFDILIKHLISSKSRVLEYVNTLGTNLYIDSSLATYFEIIKRIEIFYAEHDIMDNDDFISIMKHLDEINTSSSYEKYAHKILNEVIANSKEDKEFQDCLKTIMKCEQDVSKTRLYNRAINSVDYEDIKKFENIRKKNVTIVKSKED